jgi:hypothetical protein
MKWMALCSFTGNAPYDTSFSSLQSPHIWWQLLPKSCNMLSIVALVLFSVVPHAADIERVFSLFGWIHSDRRNRCVPAL